MNFSGAAVLCLLACWGSAPQSIEAAPQRPKSAARSAATSDQYSAAPYVVEQCKTALRFENDGTGERTLSKRIRIHNEVAAKQLSELTFPFDSNAEQIEVLFVRVRKPDGTAVSAGPEAITEAAAPAVRDAPAYANAKEKHVAVPPLQAGDILEYEVVTRIVHPIAAGEFWAQHAFLKHAIALDERLEISVPQGRNVIVRSSGFPYSTDTISARGRVIYRWKHANLAPSPDSNESLSPNQVGQATQPDVLLTSFASWSGVSRWYARLERNSAKPVPEIQSKAAELTANRSTELDKIEALYEYVATNIRYVDLPLGAAGFAPRAATEVLSDRYGDEKDKQSLLCTMLQAAGIHADAVLVAHSQKFDLSTPSPSQLDHVLTAAVSGDKMIWMDSAPQAAPFQFLPPSLRHRSALLASGDGTGKMIETPADPPFLSTQEVQMEGHVSDLGKLTARLHYRLRGDNEFVLRLAFRRTPPAQWKDLGQTLLTLDGLHGDVMSVKSGDPLDTRKPFEVDLEYTQLNFLDWSSRKAKVALPLLSIGTPDASKDSAAPIALGSPLDVTTHLQLSLPSGFAAQVPVGIAVTRDYAEFKSSYQFQDHTLTAERSLNFKMRAIPAFRRGDYLAFTHAVDADERQPLTVESTGDPVPVVPPEATARDLVEAGSAALAAGNTQSAIPLFERAVVLEPQHKTAWNDLGLAYLRLSQFDRAATAFQKQLQVNPAEDHANNYLGLAFERQEKYDEAAAAFRKQIEIDPLDTVAHAALGTLLLGQHRYFEAAPELDKATVLSPEKAELQISLGQAYINLGQNEKASQAFDRAVEISPTPAIWNNAAYNLADYKVELAKAQKYAELAVSTTAADLAKTDLEHITSAQMREVASIGNYWDTLGWVYFQKGDLDSADLYIRAAWLLGQRGEVADHLAQIYEKRGNKDEATRSFAIALAAPHSNPDTRARLTLLLGGNSQIDELVSRARPKLVALRTRTLGKLIDEDARADFALLLFPVKAPYGHASVESVRFLGGSEKLRMFAGRLRSLDYGPLFPDSSPVKLIRHGTLSCSAAANECSFILELPDEAAAAK